MDMSRTPALTCILVSVGTLLSIFRLPRSLTICRYALRFLLDSCEVLVDHFEVIYFCCTSWRGGCILYLFTVHRACIITFADVDMPITPTLGNGDI